MAAWYSRWRRRSSAPKPIRLSRYPFFFRVVNIEEIVDMMPDIGRDKLGDVVFHEFLDPIRHLAKALIAPFIVPSDNLDPRPLLSLLFNPFRDLLVAGPSSDKVLEVFSRDIHKAEEEVIERAIEVIITGRAG